MTPLSTRVATVAVLVPSILAVLFLLPSGWWAAVTLAIALAAAYEWSRLAGFGRLLAFVFLAGLAGIAALFALSGGLSRGGSGDVLVVTCGLATLFWLVIAPPWVFRRWPARSPVALTVVGWVVLAGAWIALVELQAHSPWLVLAAMAIVWIADTAAYFTGRAFGRRKLAPLVSPGKTWEGVFGGLAAVAIYALALVPFAREAGYDGPTGPLAGGLWIAFALSLALLSVVGDLFESWQKRVAGVKDSGTLLPGHGGVLDRIDALVAAMPPAALAAHWFLRG